LEEDKAAAEQKYSKMYDQMRYQLKFSAEQLQEAHIEIGRLQAQVDELQPLVRCLLGVVLVISVAHALFQTHLFDAARFKRLRSLRPPVGND
jgi:hypothetical protein